METKHYSLSEQEKQNVAVLSASGLSIHAIAVRMRRSDKVIKKHLSNFSVQQKVADIRARLTDKFQKVAERCLDRLLDEDTIEKSSPRDLATISGISVDKARLLSDLSTQNLAVTSVSRSILLDEKTLERIAALLVRRSEDPIDDDE